ncbi:hypothetical protein D0B54_00925 [Solimonas sp. K1W22B-7]|uniref:hypothetical protein n=1 Tax=Solimonas sp. K1W22B-7 TaxID=2303331 RepID=UPI000E32E21A|nr:hypothetical protein [Solimonas sp. K1W22B-7]AXQ27337.1 hypothetical protein D0B54_00925 [Solimonas sp. K1W22B-7]
MLNQIQIAGLPKPMDSWPFDQSPDCAVITLRQILDGTAAILEVSHDSDDHGWQFMTPGDPKEEDLVLICFSHLIELDSSLLELAQLEPGWIATRVSPGKPWRCEPNPDEAR